MGLKKKLKFIIIFGIIIILLGYNFYQINKINCYKESLSNGVKENIQTFAGYSGNLDSDIFLEQYANITVAHKLYCQLIDNKGILADEWKSNLVGLLAQIKYIMLNDKEKFKEVFELENGSELMFKISEDFNDKNSINSLYKLLVN